MHMTRDPRLSSLEEVMNGNPFELVDSPWGRVERWRADALAIGAMGALAQVHQIVRNDQAELEQKTVELDAKKHAVLSTINRLVKFMSRVDALTTRMEALEAKHRADEEQQREFEEPIELPPDLDRLQDLPPSKIGDETHHPSGDLHSVAAKEEPSSAEEPSDLPEPPLEEGDNIGGLPNELADPPDPVPEPKGSVVQQPTALFGN
jgi:hypothetical protein